MGSKLWRLEIVSLFFKHLLFDGSIRVFVKFLNSSAQIGNNRDQNNYLLKTCYTASCEVAGTQIEIAE